MAIRKRAWTTNGGQEKTAWVVDYKDQRGKRRLKTFSRKKDAEAWATTAQHEVKQGIHTPDSASITVDQALKLWLERSEAEGLEPSTLRQYKGHADYHIRPHSIAQTKLSALTTPAVEAFKRDLETQRGKATAQKVLGSLKAALREAQRQGLVAQNVADPVQVKNRRRAKQRPEVGLDIPTRDDVRAMIEQAQGRARSLLITAVFTGLRSSELRGLTWDHVDLENGVIYVRQRADAWGTLGRPKSAAGHRDIPMTRMVANTLKEWRLQCPNLPDAKSGAYLVFPNSKGNVEYRANIYHRVLGPIQKAAGVVDAEGRPKYGAHAMRHFYASWLIAENVTPKRVQALLGHSSIQMTFDEYGHLLDTGDESDKLAAAELRVIGCSV